FDHFKVSELSREDAQDTGASEGQRHDDQQDRRLRRSICPLCEICYVVHDNFKFQEGGDRPVTRYGGSFTTLLLAGFLSAHIDIGGADVAVRGRRRRFWIAVDDVNFVFFHEVQERPLTDALARCIFTFDVTANGVDRVSERIFSHGALHVLELGRCRVLHLCRDLGFCFFQHVIYRVGWFTGPRRIHFRRACWPRFFHGGLFRWCSLGLHDDRRVCFFLVWSGPGSRLGGRWCRRLGNLFWFRSGRRRSAHCHLAGSEWRRRDFKRRGCSVVTGLRGASFQHRLRRIQTPATGQDDRQTTND